MVSVVRRIARPAVRRSRLSAVLYLGMLMAALPLLVYLPTHLLLLKLFR